jgi:hypothetical protein
MNVEQFLEWDLAGETRVLTTRVPSRPENVNKKQAIIL